METRYEAIRFLTKTGGFIYKIANVFISNSGYITLVYEEPEVYNFIIKSRSAFTHEGGEYAHPLPLLF